MSPTLSAQQIRVQIETIENLAHCVTELSQQLAVLGNVVDELRDDFRWAVQNARLPAALPMPLILKSLPPDGTASESAHRSAPVSAEGGSPPESASPRDRPPSQVVKELTDNLIDDLGTTISHIATEQLEMVLLALDHLRADLITAVRDNHASKEQPLPFGLEDLAASAVVPQKVPPTDTPSKSPTTAPHSALAEQQKSLWPDDDE